MPTPECPACGTPGPSFIEGAHVRYYRCEECGHAWTTTKDGAGIMLHITPFPKTAKKRSESNLTEAGSRPPSADDDVL